MVENQRGIGTCVKLFTQLIASHLYEALISCHDWTCDEGVSYHLILGLIWLLLGFCCMESWTTS